jgi:cell division protein FtsI (penicillin-binding protein 3)
VFSQAGSQATRRVLFLAAFLLLWFFGICARLVYLQVLQHEDYLVAARRQQETRVEVPAPRGSIFDRTGQPLAMSLRLNTVIINPRLLKDVDVAASVLGRVLDLDAEQLRQKIERARLAGSGYMRVKRFISPEETQRLQQMNVDWVTLQPEHRRFYPKEYLASHVIGAVDHSQRGYLGVERAQNEELAGEPGRLWILQDVRHRRLESEYEQEPVSGAHLYLTIDERIQYVAERELKRAVEESKSATGSLVVMSPHTGDILAMASYPTFNPNERLRKGETMQTRFNNSVEAPFEPGSVFKVFTFAAALETTRLQPAQVIDCGGGSINLFGRRIRDHKAYSSLSMEDVLAKSSNVGTINIALRVGKETLHRYVRDFGFGTSTGIPLPAESRGRVFRPEVWTKSSIGSVAIGHEMTATTLQLARACSAVANGGLLVKPRLVAATQGENDGPVQAVPLEAGVRILKGETTIELRRQMERVVLMGTGRAARMNGYTSGGKTGSAQIYDPVAKRYTHTYNASFMGFAPVHTPKLVAVITINGARLFGGALAAPVFKVVMGEALRILDVAPDVPMEEKTPDPPKAADLADLAIAGIDPQLVPDTGPEPHPIELSEEELLEEPGAVRVPDFTGMTKRAVLEDSIAVGVAVELVGVGIARSQDPVPGAALAPGGRIKVHFGQ